MYTFSEGSRNKKVDTDIGTLQHNRVQSSIDIIMHALI